MEKASLLLFITFIMTAITIIALYLATNIYKLSAYAIIGILALITIFNNLAVSMLQEPTAKDFADTGLVGKYLTIILTALVGAVISVVILYRRFGFLKAAGIFVAAMIVDYIISLIMSMLQ